MSGRRHLRDIEAYRLSCLDNGRRVGTGAKHGFCYFDNIPTGCGCRERPAPRSTAAVALLRVTGLSVGSGDIYPAGIAFQ